MSSLGYSCHKHFDGSSLLANVLAALIHSCSLKALNRTRLHRIVESGAAGGTTNILGSCLELVSTHFLVYFKMYFLLSMTATRGKVMLLSDLYKSSFMVQYKTLGVRRRFWPSNPGSNTIATGVCSM